MVGCICKVFSTQRFVVLFKNIYLFLVLSLQTFSVFAVDISGTVNTYVKGDGDVLAGATTITYSGSFRGVGASISTGDTLLLIQSQGATIDSTNTDSYGDGVGNGNDISTTPTSAHGTDGYAGGLISQTAGTFEYAEVQSISGSTLTLTKGLSHSYSDSAAANWQIIVVPDYLTAGARLTGTLTGELWDGDTGGVIAFNATGGEIDFNSQEIDATGIGFRGGVESNAGATTDNIANVAESMSDTGGKGEGIAGTPQLVFNSENVMVDEGSSTLPGGDFGRGAPGNAGGGAGPHNSGGGGGSNAGRGGAGAQGWVGGTPVHYGGYGGQSIFSGANMGGGGGSGEANNSTLTYGGPGGGVVIIRATTATGNGNVKAIGMDAIDATAPSNGTGADGSGGGGAGGAIVMYFENTPSLPGLALDVSGGQGGDGDPDHGGGGGGGGWFCRN